MSSVSELTRMSGLVSGLDTEALVKAGTARTKTAINTKKQKLQTLQWKQESYRDVIKTMSDFQSKYLDILSKDSIRSNAVMKAHKATSSNESLSVSASSSAVDTTYEITSVQTAKAASIKGSKAASGSVALDFSNAAMGENSVTVTLDTTSRTIKFNGGENAKENFLNALNKEFDGISAAKFSFKDGSKLTIENAPDDKVTHIFTVGYSDAVGLKNDGSNIVSTKAAIESLDFSQPLVGDTFNFSINGVDFSFGKGETIKTVMDTINKSDAGVKLSFSSLAQTFTLESKETGAGQKIDITQKSGNLMNSLLGLSEDQLGTEPTKQKLLSHELKSGVSFELTASKFGLSSDDSITVNGEKLAVTGLTQKQTTQKITVDGNEINASLFSDSSGDVFKYSKDGVTHYARKEGENYTDIMTVEGGKVFDSDGNEVEGVSENESIKALGIGKKYQAYSADDIKTALNSAFKASFPDDSGSFNVQNIDGSDDVRITFTPAADKAVAIAASGNISVSDTGYTNEDGVTSNYTNTPFSVDKELGLESKMTFKVNGSSTVTVNGTGANGLVTIKDLTDSGLFKYNESTGELSVAGTDRLETVVGADTMEMLMGTSSLVGEDNNGKLNVRGSNAMVTVNGVTLESASNSFSFEGTTFGIENVKSFTEDDIANGDAEAINVDVTKDNSSIKDTIVKFVDEYNKVIDKLSSLISTERPKSNGDYFDPLTEEEKEEMDDDEIEKWEEKAKTGLLYHDSSLTKVLNNFRNSINTAVNGMTIQALGIDTSDDYEDFGKLVIKDESVLDSAIDRFGDEIAEFFTDSKKGLGASVNEAVKSAVDTSLGKTGYPKGILTGIAGVENTRSAKKNLIYSQISEVQTLIDRLNTRYESEQTRLWKQYSSLETYILNMNNQSSSLFGSSLYGTTSE